MHDDRPILPNSTDASNEASGVELSSRSSSPEDIDIRPETSFSAPIVRNQQELPLIAVSPHRTSMPSYPRRNQHDRGWTIVAVALGAVIAVIMFSTIVPFLSQNLDSAVSELMGTDDDEELSPTYPADGASVATITITLSWDASMDAEWYDVRISDDSSMSSPSQFTATESSIAITGLEIGATYYWQVRPVVDGERGSWSDVWSFTVGSASGAPVPTSPVDGTIYIDELPVLTWTSVRYSTEYWVQVSTDEDFTTIVIDAEVSTTSYSIDQGLEENATFYWRVAGNDDDGWTEWSTVRTFFISPTTIQIHRAWTFYADGSEWSLSINVSAEDYYEAKTTARTPMFSVNEYAEYVITTDAAVVEVAEILASMAESSGYDEYTTACFVLSFIQNFSYTSDEETTGYEDYPRYPIETLVEGGGDCEDTSALFASIIQSDAFGMDAVLVSLSNPTSDVGHMAVGLYLEDVPRVVTYTNNSTTYTLTGGELLSWDVRAYRFGTSYSYYYCEPTSEMPIGWPTDIEDWYFALIDC